MNKSLNAKSIQAIGMRLREEREKKQLTQPRLADLANIGHAQITRIERGVGNPTMNTLLQLARAMEISVHKLIPPDL
ncbi:helix-turn-helix domain-containing protein [Mucilaginibacter gossypii]|uniref:DNA adenine methylase n=1 Tax=Mucilaginibacter gossypii TaxID=551996 RepID=A0A1G8A3M4_9SPHI|nr:helix-turn-helix transcriptional regulator [Mucilaginibacter gossypii]SDH15539.1 DNA adenine methylase [Mucilaginibacter gossypii]